MIKTLWKLLREGPLADSNQQMAGHQFVIHAFTCMYMYMYMYMSMSMYMYMYMYIQTLRGTGEPFN